MNLLEMTNLICGQVRATDAGEVSLCKDFLRRRHEMIWNDALWRESIFQFTKAFNPTAATLEGALHATGICLLKIGAGVSADYFYQSLYPNSVDRILALRYEDGIIPVAHEEEMFQTYDDRYDDTGNPLAFHVLPKVVEQFAENVVWYYKILSASDVGKSYSAAVRNSNYGVIQESGTFGTNDQWQNLARGTTLEFFNKPTTTGDVMLGYIGSLSASQVNTAYILSSKKAAPQYWRIRLVQIPTKAVTLRFLVKRSMPMFENDTDTPHLTSIENCLIAFATGDMLRFLRRYAQADSHFAEGQALLEQLKKVETVQMAHRQRIVPAEDFYQHTRGFNWDKNTL